MPRKKLKFYDLKETRVRQSWHPINLYNLSRLFGPRAGHRTVFQQKWKAKSFTRPYHGEQIREGQWERQFSRHIPSVVPMDAAILAKSDGSDMAAGRGRGRDAPPDYQKATNVPTPYMSMVYHPQERRLDTSIFRALFASSARQARQLVTHGHVKVNGKKMLYPGYLLNPGDMFSVDPEMVMYCTGQGPRMNSLRHNLTRYQGKTAVMEAYRAPFFALLRSVSSLSRVYQSRTNTNSKIIEELQALREDMSQYNFGPGTAPEALYNSWKTRFDLIRLQEPLFDQEYIRASFILDSLLLRASKQIERAERKQSTAKKEDSTWSESKSLSEAITELNSFRKSITEALDGPLTVPLALSFRDTYRKILGPRHAAASSITDTFTSVLDPVFASPSAQSTANSKAAGGHITEHLRTLALINFKWKTKDYMSPFAFIPRYLEVNQNVCSAVYLRHPVARPGLAEVPSPFSSELLTLAFQWYLRRR